MRMSIGIGIQGRGRCTSTWRHALVCHEALSLFFFDRDAMLHSPCDAAVPCPGLFQKCRRVCFWKAARRKDGRPGLQQATTLEPPGGPSTHNCNTMRHAWRRGQHSRRLCDRGWQGNTSPASAVRSRELVVAVGRPEGCWPRSRYCALPTYISWTARLRCLPTT
jgi:hypothetical protein